MAEIHPDLNEFLAWAEVENEAHRIRVQRALAAGLDPDTCLVCQEAYCDGECERVSGPEASGE